MKTFFSKIFSGQIATSCIILVIMSCIFSAAIRSSISSWNFDKQDELKNLLLPVISKTYRLSGSLSESSLERALLPYITDSLYVYVFDADRKPVLLLEQGKPKTLPEVEKNTGPISSFLSLNPPAAITEGDTAIGYLAVDNVDFLAYKANRIFLSTMEKALLIGGLVAVLCALGLSLFTSSAFSKKASTLSNAITSLSMDEQQIPFTGIHEFDQVTEAVIRLRERLNREESLRRQWMQDISHDLRTPLTAVKMQVEGLSDGVLQPDESRFSMLYSELNHIERLVCNLQDLSRYESPEMHIQPGPIDPHLFTVDLAERFSLIAERTHISLDCQVDWQYPDSTRFLGDVLLLQRCVSNIVQNAFQHTEQGGQILFTLTGTSPGNEHNQALVTMKILNSGSIAEADIPLVFDRLYRSDRSRSSEGNGLGLTIAKAIVNLHKGTISIANSGTASDPQVQVLIQFPLLAAR